MIADTTILTTHTSEKDQAPRITAIGAKSPLIPRSQDHISDVVFTVDPETTLPFSKDKAPRITAIVAKSSLIPKPQLIVAFAMINEGPQLLSRMNTIPMIESTSTNFLVSTTEFTISKIDLYATEVDTFLMKDRAPCITATVAESSLIPKPQLIVAVAIINEGPQLLSRMNTIPIIESTSTNFLVSTTEFTISKIDLYATEVDTFLMPFDTPLPKYGFLIVHGGSRSHCLTKGRKKSSKDFAAST